MLKLFKKKESAYIDLESYDYSAFARDMTEEELLTVNGGKWIGNSDESVAGAEVGDTLRRNDGTVVTITQADIDWAKEHVGSTPANTATETANTSSPSSSGSSMSNTPQASVVKRDSTPEKESSTILGNIARYRAMAGNNQIKPNTVTGTKAEGNKIEGTTANGSGFSHKSGKFGDSKKEEEIKNTSTIEQQDRGFPTSRTPDVGTFYPRQKTNSENRKIKTAAQEYVENMKRKNFTTEFADWGKLETDADNMRMQDYAKYTNEDDIEEQKTIRAKDGTMNGNNHFSLVGCKMCGAAKIASEVAGHKVEMKDDINDLYDANGDGYLSREEVEEAIRAQLPEGKTVQSDWFEKTLTKEKLDEIAGWEGTTYILGMAENVYKGEPHWVVLTGYSVNDKGQVQFDYSPTSSNDLVNNRQFILGDKQSGQNNYFTISHIQTFTIL